MPVRRASAGVRGNAPTHTIDRRSVGKPTVCVSALYLCVFIGRPLLEIRFLLDRFFSPHLIGDASVFRQVKHGKMILQKHLANRAFHALMDGSNQEIVHAAEPSNSPAAA